MVSTVLYNSRIDDQLGKSNYNITVERLTPIIMLCAGSSCAFKSMWGRTDVIISSSCVKDYLLCNKHRY